VKHHTDTLTLMMMISCILDDHSRVLIHSSECDSDYVNANYVDVSDTIPNMRFVSILTT